MNAFLLFHKFTLSVFFPSFRRNFLFGSLKRDERKFNPESSLVFKKETGFRICVLQSQATEELVRNDGFFARSFLKPALLTSLVLLAACGFSPIYGAHDNGGKPVIEALNAVQIENIPDRNGQMLKNKLMDRMYAHGRPHAPSARLSINLSATEASLGIQKDATTTRSQLTLAASFDLTDMTGRLLHRGIARSTVGYSKLDAQYGTLASQKNAYERGINEIGEQIINHLSLYYAEKAAPSAQE